MHCFTKNKLLRQISKPVEQVGNEEQKLMDDMLDTMYEANGIGLAAIQIGVPKRVILFSKLKFNAVFMPRITASP